MDPIARGPVEGQTQPAPIGGSVTFKARSAETDGALTVFQSLIEPGEDPPLHVHPEHDETLYVLEGFVRFRLEDELHDGPVGSFVYIPRGTPHTWQNAGSDRVRLLVSFVPGAPGMERFFTGAAEAEGADPAELFQRVPNGGEMEIAGPPLAVSHPV